MTADALFDVPAAGGVLTGAVISPCGTYRYTLDRVWDRTRPTALFIMLNPSTADASTDDPTIRRCRSFAEREGCGALTVVNLFAYRATNPAELHTAADPVGPDNLLHLCLALSNNPAVVIAAWGAHPLARTQRRITQQALTKNLRHAFCLGTTKDGSPRHPLYVRSDQQLAPWTPTK